MMNLLRSLWASSVFGPVVSAIGLALVVYCGGLVKTLYCEVKDAADLMAQGVELDGLRRATLANAPDSIETLLGGIFGGFILLVVGMAHRLRPWDGFPEK